ncbi:MAG: protein-disulfide reductase DsbD domain-containing protein [Pseudomonadota bacterium]
MLGHQVCQSLSLRLVLVWVASVFAIAASVATLAEESGFASAPLSSPSLFRQEQQTPTLGVTPSEPVFLPVEEAYRLAVEQVGPNEILLLWQIQPGYYLYRHSLEFSATRNGDAVAVSSSIPEGLQREDEYFGKVEVYYSELAVSLSFDGPLVEGSLVEGSLAGNKLEISSQGCADAGLCYPPRTQFFQLDTPGVGGQSGVASDRVTITELTARDTPLPAAKATTSSGLENFNAWSLLLMAAFAFAGGLILNLMPCVLPILSLKVISFTCAAPEVRRQHGVFYSLGVISSFLVVALLLISLRSGGQAMGWGFQLQSTGFVVALAYLFVVLGFSLSGLVQLGGAQFMNLGNSLAEREGPSGSFFTGVLAVLVASPCTAPFMGSALGYALVRPPFEALLVFAALGLGMAAPMFALSHSELARRYMPKPGEWTEKLKQFLAFPLYATALWLFWVAGRQVGIDFMAATLLGALLLALGIWLWSSGGLVVRGLSVACLLVAASIALWRPELSQPGSGKLPAGAVAYSPERLSELRRSGRDVFVDVTADWCITCLANERAVLATDAIQDAFRQRDVVYMVADWTDYDPVIADFVESHGRSGIPLYVVYEGEESPKVLPQILRKQTVLSSLPNTAPTRLALRD